MTEMTLRAWLDRAWNDHATDSRRVADALGARAASLPDDADGAEAVRLAEHVMLAHLGDVAALQRLLAAAPAGAALAPSRQRAAWALATLAGEPAPLLADAPRWRALHSVVMVLIGRGQVAEARALLLADEAAAAAHPDAETRKAYAATANNTASDLHAGPRGDAARDALMLEAAALSRRAWAGAGTWINVERADYLLALCHASVGDASAALAHASACLARCEAEGADAAELFFAHACTVQACRAAGDGTAAADHRSRMVALLPEIGDPGLQAYCRQTLDKT